MARRSLQLMALRAFEAAARCGSFTRAARELHVTHGAISQQVKILEDRLGRRLFERLNRGVRLTKTGEALWPVLRDSFDRMETALAAMTLEKADQALRVTTTPTFASGWLIPRLKSLQAVPAGIEINLQHTLAFADLTGGEADVGIRCGQAPWSGLEAELLFPIHMTPVCSPALLERIAMPCRPQDLLQLPLLHADTGSHPRGEEWRLWFAAAGVNCEGPLPGQSFRDPALSLQAAQSGLGVALAYLELLGTEPDPGQLVRPMEALARHPYSYYLVYPTARRQEPKVRAFRDWILHEVSARPSTQQTASIVDLAAPDLM